MYIRMYVCMYIIASINYNRAKHESAWKRNKFRVKYVWRQSFWKIIYYLALRSRPPPLSAESYCSGDFFMIIFSSSSFYPFFLFFWSPPFSLAFSLYRCTDFYFIFFNWYFVFKLIFLKTSNEYSSYSNSLNDNELMGTNLREVASHSTALVMRGSCTYMCVFQQMQLQLSLHCRRWSIVQKKSWCYPTSRKLMITRQNNSKSKWPLFRFGNTEINTVQLVYRCLLAY